MSANNQIKETNPITVTSHLISKQSRYKDASGDFTLLLASIQLACKFISSKVRRAGLLNITGLVGDINVQGEEVKKMDVIANEIFINSLKASGKVSVMVSEENEDIIFIKNKEIPGKYCVVFDPLDGSSNIDAGVSIGTIFGIYSLKEGSSGNINDVLRPGREMIASGYAMYGSFSMLVLATTNDVNGYTLDPMKVKPRGKIYSVNEGNSRYWTDSCKEYFESLKNPENKEKQPYSARYIGSMVADVHRTLLYGGVFSYPADSKSPNGKLRLLYECFPMAFIIENAGGLSTDGENSILDIVPNQIHSRWPIFLGSKEDILSFIEIHKKYIQ